MLRDAGPRFRCSSLVLFGSVAQSLVAEEAKRRHWLPSVFSTNERLCSGGCKASLLYVFGGSLGSCGMVLWRGGTGGAVLGTGHRLFWLALSGQPLLGMRGDGVLGGVLGELGELLRSQL